MYGIKIIVKGEDKDMVIGVTSINVNSEGINFKGLPGIDNPYILTISSLSLAKLVTNLLQETLFELELSGEVEYFEIVELKGLEN